MAGRSTLLVEALLFAVIAVLAYFSYTTVASRMAVNEGGACPDGSLYHVGPGTINVTYDYHDYFCGVNQTLTLRLANLPDSLCGSNQFIANSSLVLPFNSTGSPAASVAGPGYSPAPLGARPSYLGVYNGTFYVSLLPAADRTGLWSIYCPYASISVQGQLRVYYDQSTGLPLRIDWVYPSKGGDVTLWSLQARRYVLQDSQGRLYVPGLPPGLALAGTAGVMGASIALALKRLVEAAAA
ncbi:MAG: hypothetical protein LRS49_01915 [Desulfurococcales archaeon]|nr:hypothetical protein [Desulfurococcales archaeon]